MSKVAESDIRMMIATQVAYLDGGKGLTVKDIIDRTISNYGGRSDLLAREQSQLDTALYVRQMIESNGLYDCNRWKLMEVDDRNSDTGFYACLIDTRDGEAIVGFRGSESFDTNQIKNDWIAADAGLLNNPETTQQRQAQQFTEYVNSKYMDRYNAFNFTGHSLGGNLAEHATVTAPDGMKIGRCINLDGPGYSDEYISAHKWEIADRAKYIDHYQYSVVGSLLYPLKGTNYQTIKASNDEYTDPPLNIVWRHHTRNIEFDSNGSVQNGKMDPLAAVIGPGSRGLESGALGIACAFSPTLTALWLFANKGYAALLEMKSDAEHLVESIGKVIDQVRESVKNWFRNMFGYALTGEYEMNVSSVNSVCSGYDDAAKKLERIGTEISNIASGLQYYSIAGTYIRSSLWSLSTKVRNSSKKTSALANAGRDCARFTVSDDSKAAQCFVKI